MVLGAKWSVNTRGHTQKCGQPVGGNLSLKNTAHDHTEIKQLP